MILTLTVTLTERWLNADCGIAQEYAQKRIRGGMNNCEYTELVGARKNCIRYVSASLAWLQMGQAETAGTNKLLNNIG